MSFEQEKEKEGEEEPRTEDEKVKEKGNDEEESAEIFDYVTMMEGHVSGAIPLKDLSNKDLTSHIYVSDTSSIHISSKKGDDPGLDASNTSLDPAARMKKLNSDLRSFQNGFLPLNENGTGIYIRYDCDDPSYMKCMMTGPEGTPYAWGLFEFDIFVPPNYPNIPPKVTFKTTNGGQFRFNPNLYDSGYVCLSLLGTWSGPQWEGERGSLCQIFNSIQALVLVEDPYYNEPGYSKDRNSGRLNSSAIAYRNRIREATLRFAMRDQLLNPDPVWRSVILQHFQLTKDSILQMAENWLEDLPYCEMVQKNGAPPNHSYNQNILGQRSSLEEAVNELKEILERIAFLEDINKFESKYYPLLGEDNDDDDDRSDDDTESDDDEELKSDNNDYGNNRNISNNHNNERIKSQEVFLKDKEKDAQEEIFPKAREKVAHLDVNTKKIEEEIEIMKLIKGECYLVPSLWFALPKRIKDQEQEFANTINMCSRNLQQQKTRAQNFDKMSKKLTSAKSYPSPLSPWELNKFGFLPLKIPNINKNSSISGVTTTGSIGEFKNYNGITFVRLSRNEFHEVIRGKKEGLWSKVKGKGKEKNTIDMMEEKLHGAHTLDSKSPSTSFMQKKSSSTSSSILMEWVCDYTLATVIGASGIIVEDTPTLPSREDICYQPLKIIPFGVKNLQVLSEVEPQFKEHPGVIAGRRVMVGMHGIILGYASMYTFSKVKNQQKQKNKICLIQIAPSPMSPKKKDIDLIEEEEVGEEVGEEVEGEVEGENIQHTQSIQIVENKKYVQSLKDNKVYKVADVEQLNKNHPVIKEPNENNAKKTKLNVYHLPLPILGGNKEEKERGKEFPFTSNLIPVAPNSNSTFNSNTSKPYLNSNYMINDNNNISSSSSSPSSSFSSSSSLSLSSSSSSPSFPCQLLGDNLLNKNILKTEKERYPFGVEVDNRDKMDIVMEEEEEEEADEDEEGDNRVFDYKKNTTTSTKLHSHLPFSHSALAPFEEKIFNKCNLPYPDPERVKLMVEGMGFSTEEATFALQHNRNDVNEASNFILERGGKLNLDATQL